jgi:hypothetical protein
MTIGCDRLVVFITGDVTIDWNLAHVARSVDHGECWNTEDVTRACWHPGGAALTARLVQAIADHLKGAGQGDVQVIGPMLGNLREMPCESLRPDNESFHHTYAMWQPFGSGNKDAAGKPTQVWRVERFMGVDKASAESTLALPKCDAPDIIVLDNGDLGFRDRPNLWPKAIEQAEQKPWVVLKMPPPVLQGGLFEHVVERCGDRLIVVMTVDYLRRSEVQISRGLSWERTAEDLIRELTTNPRVNSVLRCAHTVVSLGSAGAFVLSCTQPPRDSRALPKAEGRLFFDPQKLEGEWEGPQLGHTVGQTATLTAAVVHQLMLGATDPTGIAAGVQSGIAAIRRLHEIGYGTFNPDGPPCLEFPWQTVAEEITRAQRPLTETKVPEFDLSEIAQRLSVENVESPRRVKPSWRIELTPESNIPEKVRRYWESLDGRQRPAAWRLVRKGIAAALPGVPVATFGDLVTVDREEAEALRSIRNLMSEYSAGKQTRPLSIAVFGPPGSGKSYGIEQVAKSIRPGEVEPLTFNLSQFASPGELHGALHRVRDAALKGKLPLVFWDEFDATVDGRPLGWLRYFLAPMQDGAFQEGQIEHPIGRAVFVFAGGTSPDLASFGGKLSEEDRLSAKLRDFVSRLKGFLNVRGPNRQTDAADGDPFYILRRAQLLRSLLWRHANHLFDGDGPNATLRIDPGVLRALLHIRHYKHGARSLESIILTSTLTGKSAFERSSLPASEQLELHMPSDEFRALVQELTMTSDLLEQLAKAAHDIYCAGKKRDGWVWGPEKSEEKKTHPLLVEYEKLPERYKESNRRTVRDIPKKLARLGHVMIAAGPNDPPLVFTEEQVETLSEYEHELWVDAQLAAGFTPGTPTADDPLRNEYLVPWTDVPDDIKQIDRDLVKGIPEILKLAGYTAKRAG